MPTEERPFLPSGPDAALVEGIREYIAIRRNASFGEPPPALGPMLEKARAPSFRDTLLSMIRERGLVDSRVYEAAGVDRRHYSKIRNNRDWRPTKITAVSFAIALRLDLREAGKLLRSAGFSFSAASDFDLICSYFIEHRNWNSGEVNEALFAFHQPLVCGAALS